jgi:hypothetical protein
MTTGIAAADDGGSFDSRSFAKRGALTAPNPYGKAPPEMPRGLHAGQQIELELTTW